MLVPVAVMLAATCYTPFTSLYLLVPRASLITADDRSVLLEGYQKAIIVSRLPHAHDGGFYAEWQRNLPSGGADAALRGQVE